MKKLLIFISILLCVSSSMQARHIKGGFFNYIYLGPGVNDPGKLRYRITLTVYMDCDAEGMQIDNPLKFTIYDAKTLAQVANPSVSIKSNNMLSKRSDEVCITGNQAICFYKVVKYEISSIELPANAGGYVISYQRCCRLENMDNLRNSGDLGSTYSIKIPGTDSPVPDANKNSSPIFAVNDTAVVCENSYFTYQVAAFDPEGDSLVYTLCSAYTGGSRTDPAPNPAAAPPYPLVSYQSPFSGGEPLGPNVTIDPRKGIISGIAPSIKFTGEYVVTICVAEYRKGVFFALSRKELHVRVQDCVPLVARLSPKQVTCDGFDVNFSNDVVNPGGTDYVWNFGDPFTGPANTSTAAKPAHVYSDTGVYTVKLKVSQGGLCADSTTLTVKVYPGFFPAFNINPPFCKGVPVRFTDKTSTRFGVPVGWQWDFGDANVLNDTSRNQNPSYVYNTPGTYTATLIVGNTFGCIDTVQTDVVIADNPPLTVFPKDTVFCAKDSVSLLAAGTGNLSWTPNTNILRAATNNPLVFPGVPAKYFVTLNLNGCISKDSVTLIAKNDLTNSITASSISICEDDTLTLTGSSNYTSNVSWSWSPAASTLRPFDKITKAFPPRNTTFNLLTRWGSNCISTASKAIVVKPLLVPDAGPDAAICRGQQTTALQATGADGYTWSPADGLNNVLIPNPVASPDITTVYKVKGSTTGCTGTKTDSVTVLVRQLPLIALTNDTLICSIDTLQLKAIGTGSFLWSPNYMISSLTAAAPLVSPDVPTTYYVQLTDQFACINKDSVKVDVKLFVTLSAGNDTTICRTDGFFINTSSDALQYRWVPAAGLSSDTAKRPFATPLAATSTYQVFGNIGKCQSTDFITIKTVPYPVADAGNDTLICFGQSAQLMAGGGSGYTWAPTRYLSAGNIADPLSLKPLRDIKYTVTVTDTLGCPKPVTDTVWVRVYPRVQAGTGIRDTSMVIGESLQLNATGGNNSDSYVWAPAAWLDNPGSRNPLAIPEQDIQYRVTITTRIGNCTGSDSVKIKVYLLPPGLYVPTAFSPNGDGNNEVLKPIAIGMRKINYFNVYNRLGQLIFSTTQVGKGWDGYYKGRPQDPAAYVWTAAGITYKGDAIVKKGTAVLIR